MKNVLTIAGSDSCGGAGIQADLKTFGAHGVYGMSVITSVTAQNTLGVFDAQDIRADIIGKQIDAIFQDIKVDAVKIGMVSNIESINIINEKMKLYKPANLVIDPVMISKSGFSLLKEESKAILIKKLIPLADVLTPNIPEAEAIIEEAYKEKIEIKNLEDMIYAAKRIKELGAKSVLVKGGHLKDRAVDVFYNGEEVECYEKQRVKTKNTHGTGCTLSSSIASNLALDNNKPDSIRLAKEYVTEAIEYSLNIGHGVGPTNHFYRLYKRAGLNYE
ncbi:MAG: bifunctional hydroxymethylpyrimidine kinase/phosphomethylpyrimidine kinase [Clostridiaceae bacterium]